MSTQPLLIEIGTEELPPKALGSIADHFANRFIEGLANQNIAYGDVTIYASPRRFGIKIDNVALKQPDQTVERRGPAVSAAYDAEGNPTKALEGFARSCQADIKGLSTLKTAKGEWLVYHAEQPGADTTTLIPELIEHALKQLPIPKLMRWGDLQQAFVRPVHWIVVLLGSDVVPVSMFGIDSDRYTRGHHFKAPEPLELRHANDYEQALAQVFVMPKLDTRCELIHEQVKTCAAIVHGSAVVPDGLLKEVANIVEWPQAVLCNFDPAFLTVPQEALISSMQSHQKCFALKDAKGKLLPHFITVTNVVSDDTSGVIAGNQKVMHARLSDAAFFYESDCKRTLESYLPALAKTTFQHQLGSLGDKSERISALSGYLAAELGLDSHGAKHAGLLAKADLMSDMVGEFPELQGIMGGYYALNDQEPVEIADAILEHYQPRFASDDIAPTDLGQVIAIADKVDTLVGIFGIGQAPTGSKDPFALRRAALGILRTIIEGKLTLNLHDVLQHAAGLYHDKLTDAKGVENALNFCFERLKAYYQDQDIAADIIQAVMAVQPMDPLDFDFRIKATHLFSATPEAATLAESNKRVQNLLQKADTAKLPAVDPKQFIETPESVLFSKANEVAEAVAKQVEEQEYSAAYRLLAGLDAPLNHFFTDVMVMTEDKKVRDNRLALLHFLYTLFIQVADISKLQLI